ncbi:MAG: hypothetical protein H6826_09770 [Planctomycetes bacterium]|nr:hypothetical protein [Planctomycetota bacterium]MCB9825982.1 hypothetical protein [Planctomycetota bacterium]MCB9901621.1 hypothetical protein [Planctomycetota bacterium]
MRFHVAAYDAATSDATTARGSFCLAAGHEIFDHHFPERAVVPGNTVLEAAAQLAHLHEMAQSSGTTAFLLDRVVTARWTRLVGPDERVDITLSPKEAADGRRGYDVRCAVGDEPSATIEIEGRLVPHVVKTREDRP